MTFGSLCQDKEHEPTTNYGSGFATLGISEKILYDWRSKAQASEGSTGNLKEENKELRKKLKEVERERDILKKALSIFSRST